MKSRNKPPSEFYIINRIKKTMQIEYQIAKSSNKISSHFKKWDRIINLLARDQTVQYSIELILNFHLFCFYFISVDDERC